MILETVSFEWKAVPRDLREKSAVPAEPERKETDKTGFGPAVPKR
jgi:hypothetical protein